MRKLNNRGTAAWEFVLIAVPFFLMVFTIFDIGRYAITQYSLSTLASAGARALAMNCYGGKVISNQSPSTCTTDPMFTSDSAKQAVAPFLYFGGLTPTLVATPGAKVLTVTATQPNFAWIMPIWGTLVNKPKASATIPF